MHISLAFVIGTLIVVPQQTSGAASLSATSTHSRTQGRGARSPTKGKQASPPTAADQGQSDADRKITQQIRKAVMDDSTLSFAAKNVEIITIKGKVTLRGEVDDARERSAVFGAARNVVGTANVNDQMAIKRK